MDSGASQPALEGGASLVEEGVQAGVPHCQSQQQHPAGQEAECQQQAGAADEQQDQDREAQEVQQERRSQQEEHAVEEEQAEQQRPAKRSANKHFCREGLACLGDINA